MLHMPVATLRVWERRYALTNTAVSPSGQRLYADDDVRRLAMLKQLSDQGHAIGRLALLSWAQLQDVAAHHARTAALTQPPQRHDHAAPWRLAVVGPALAGRLQRPALLQHLGRPVELLGPFDDIAHAASALATAGDTRPPDAWLFHQAQLHAGWWAAVEAAAPHWLQPQDADGAAQVPVPVAVLYGFGAEAVCEAVALRGVALLREPQPDVALAHWLRHWADATARQRPGPPAAPQPGLRPAAPPDSASVRRWSDGALAHFAAMSSSVACECPRHVAELLVQLGRFETYSVQCQHRSPGDAELHAYLARMAGEVRARFEEALERVARQEGLPMPQSTA